MKYRVWTKDAFKEYPTCHTDWLTKTECKKYILGRWGHWPGWASISTAKYGERVRF